MAKEAIVDDDDESEADSSHLHAKERTSGAPGGGHTRTIIERFNVALTAGGSQQLPVPTAGDAHHYPLPTTFVGAVKRVLAEERRQRAELVKALESGRVPPAFQAVLDIRVESLAREAHLTKCACRVLRSPQGWQPWVTDGTAQPGVRPQAGTADQPAGKLHPPGVPGTATPVEPPVAPGSSPPAQAAGPGRATAGLRGGACHAPLPARPPPQPGGSQGAAPHGSPAAHQSLSERPGEPAGAAEDGQALPGRRGEASAVGTAACVFFNTRDCADVDLEPGRLVRIFPPWREVVLEQQKIILCTMLAARID